MNQMEKRRLFKYALATYFSILAVYLFQFKMTTSIAFSAIFVITYGPTRYHDLSYSLNRMLAQLIGVLVGGILHLLINWEALSFVPPSQRMALAMTIGLVSVLGIKYCFHLDIADFTMFTPVFLVLLMTPGNSRYPFLRLVYCLIGIVVGSIINFLIYPCPANLWTGLDQKIQRENALCTHQMEAFLKTEQISESEHNALSDLMALSAELDRGLSALNAHKPSCRRVPAEELTRWNQQHQLNAAFLKVLQQIAALPSTGLEAKSAADLKHSFCPLFWAHYTFLQQGKVSESSIVFILPSLESRFHDLLLAEAELITYYQQIQKCSLNA